MHARSLIPLALCVAFAACDKKEEPAPADDGKSVAEGAKARTMAGEQVETAKKNIHEVEGQLQERDDAILNAGQEENSAQRGMQP